MTRGSKPGLCETVALLGTGGIGEVWKDRDARLDVVALRPPRRIVPIRFEREARAIAAPNHPHILSDLRRRVWLLGDGVHRGRNQVYVVPYRQTRQDQLRVVIQSRRINIPPEESASHHVARKFDGCAMTLSTRGDNDP